MSWTIPIYEEDNEEWRDDGIHDHYNVPMVAVRANPHVLIHCDVRRDTASGLHTSVKIDRWINTEYFIWEMAAGLADSGINPKWTQLFEKNHKATWVQVQDEFDGIADLPERFLHKVKAPPFQVVQLRIRPGPLSRYWRLRANTGKEMADTAFWDLWKSVLKQDVSAVGPFDVILRAPSRIPAGEDVIDPWNMSPSNDRYDNDLYADCFRSDRIHTFDKPVLLDSLRLPEEGYGDVYPPANRSRSSSHVALRSLSHRLRDRISLSCGRERYQDSHRSCSAARKKSLTRRMRSLRISETSRVSKEDSR